MPNPAKAKLRAVLDLKMSTLSTMHAFYIKGLETCPVLTTEQVRDAYDFLENVEKLLIGTGYLTQREVNARHTRRVEAIGDQTIIHYPFV